ncbi:helix-turn-helix domain-containing protein [Streptomyces sp. NBC_01304]|uniref:helix-turn-helix domain-containing protein n=1 Tax=Streptomyces sp. NBC_01304 TaxID=2903818 RepID=UPI003FA368B4
MHVKEPDRFRELMRLQNFSQRTLAARAKVSQAFISLLLRGKRGTRATTAWRIARALGVLTDELFAGASGPLSVVDSGQSATAPTATPSVKSSMASALETSALSNPRRRRAAPRRASPTALVAA